MAQTHEIVAFEEVFYDSQCMLGESPIYRPEDDTLHYVDILSDPPQIQILPLSNSTRDTQSDSEATKARVLSLKESTSVVAFRKNHPGSYIAAFQRGFAFIDEKTGELEVLKEIIPQIDSTKFRFNDGAVDSRGRFWAGEIDLVSLGVFADSTPVTPAEPNSSPGPKGRLWRYDPDGTVSSHLWGICGSNGLGWSPDNKYMYFTDSYVRVIWRFEFDEQKGSIEGKVDFLDFRDDAVQGNDTVHPKPIPEHLLGGQPDGLIIDTEGNLWVALWEKGRVVCFDNEGNLLREIVCDETPYLTCAGWGGKDLDVLYCTSAHRDWKGGVKGGKLYKIDVGKRWGTRGLEKFRFRG